MIKKLSIATLVALFIFILPLQQFQAQASTSVKVTTKKLKYNNQEYIQLSGGNKPATTAINKVLKNHAVQADKFNKENKKNNGWYQTNVEVKLNQNEQISVGYTDTLNIGGVTNIKADTYYNYSLRTGKEIKMSSIIKTQTQKENLIEAVSSGLKVQKLKKGLDIYEESIASPPLAEAQFYLTSNGIVIYFNRYSVAIESPIEVPISMTTINKTPLVTKKITNPLQFTLGEQAKNELQKGIIPGFEGIKLGMSKKNLLERFSTAPNNTFFYMGSDYITFSKNDVRFGFVQIGPDTLDHLFIGKNAFSYKNISEVEAKLGKGKVETYTDVDDEETTSTRNYTFGKINLVFFLDKKDSIEYIQIYQK